MKLQFHLPLSTYPDASPATIINNAIDFAHQNGADIFASIPQVRIPAIHQPFPTTIDFDSWRLDAETYSHEQGVALRTQVAEVAGVKNVQHRLYGFDAKEPFVFDRIAEISRNFDLSIIEASQTTRKLSETVLFGSGRPLVLFPEASFCGRVETVAIAWDGSASAARAICAARVFLERATRLLVISITDDKPIDTGNRELLLSSFKQSGLNVEDVSLQAGSETPAEAIQAAALERKADLLIAGGYGHSRLRELIVGGVTRELLGKTELPVLLAH